MVAGVLIGFGWEKAHVMSIGAYTPQRTAMIDFLWSSAVVDGEDFTLLEKREFVLKPLMDRLSDFEASGRIFEEDGVRKDGHGEPGFESLWIEEEFFEVLIEDANGKGVEELI